MEIIRAGKGNPENIIVKTKSGKELAFSWDGHDTQLTSDRKFYQVSEETTGILKLFIPIENIDYIECR